MVYVAKWFYVAKLFYVAIVVLCGISGFMWLKVDKCGEVAKSREKWGRVRESG